MGPDLFLQVSQALDRTLTFGSEYMVRGQTWNRQRFNSLPGSFRHCGSSPQVSSRDRLCGGTLKIWRMSSAQLPCRASVAPLQPRDTGARHRHRMWPPFLTSWGASLSKHESWRCGNLALRISHLRGEELCIMRASWLRATRVGIQKLG